MRLYLDANSIIDSIEGVVEFRLAVLGWIEKAEAVDGVVVTSRLSRLECRVKPLRDENAALLELSIAPQRNESSSASAKRSAAPGEVPR